MDEFEFVALHMIVDDDDHWAGVDEYRHGDNQFLLGHIWFEKFTPSIYKRLLNEWRLFRRCISGSIFAMCDDGDPEKWEHFVSRLGFVPTGLETPCNNGAVRQLFISRASDEHS